MRLIISILMLTTLLSIMTSAAYPQDRQQMIGKVFEIKYKKPSDLEKVLTTLLSSGGKITASDSINTITVRDFPENVGVVEDAIKRLDVLPPPPPPAQFSESLELQLNVILATMSQAQPGLGEKKEMPKHLAPIIMQLRSTLKYTTYNHAFTGLHRLVHNSSTEASGVLGSLLPELPIYYQYRINNVVFDKNASGVNGINIQKFSFGATIPVKASNYKDIGITTPLSLSVGETVVVGTANISGTDDAIIIIVTVKKLKE